jgi:branched-subunit amino acid ABC-type transport system permease component
MRNNNTSIAGKLMAINSTLISGLLLGLQRGFLLMIIALGLTLIFGMLDVINFAHGAFYAFGAYIGATAASYSGNFWIGLLGAFISISLLGLLVEVVLLRRIYDRDPIYNVLLTFGLALVINSGINIIWRGETLGISLPSYLSGSFDTVVSVLPFYRIFILVLSVFVIVSLLLFFRYTSIGVVIRACAEKPEIVGSLGINTKMIYTAVFALGVGLAGAAGFLVGGLHGVESNMGDRILIESFFIVIIGGLGSVRGATLAALLFGITSVYSQLYFSEISNFLTFGFVGLVLLLRPKGLYGGEGI